MNDYPLDIHGAHGRIDAYRAALIAAADALLAAWPYVNGVACDPSTAPWRRETATDTLATMQAARERIGNELAVTNP